MTKTEKDEGSHPQNDVAAEVDPEKQLAPPTSTDPEQPAPEYEYMTGVKLWLLLVSITLTVFLMMLDESIIVTVSSSCENQWTFAQMRDTGAAPLHLMCAKSCLGHSTNH
jgi:hypothetical protein